jgi:hypothetical protein
MTTDDNDNDDNNNKTNNNNNSTPAWLSYFLENQQNSGQWQKGHVKN